ncbi:shikimate dehydrogenase [Pantoea sp. ICBG 828]|uniref:SDR family NAD(P)-dependent oxidoreductase n=1 Tax=unclassified Pantoea TaxID=2630326 RepID=UPI000CE4BFDE|nr:MULTISPECIES: SDR family NAD(P)-dependent oxidoreductase [unclassified Pantoea]NIG36096.1 SDR family NAD(P)-dependent oxidoreductase [Pantoea sp. Ap-959]PPC65572.1 shikimate dehydrogenase [Pantoea sp. ICBG 828]
MKNEFNAESSTDDVLKGQDLSGKRILVTGASAGLGVETARSLVAHGAEVIGAVRDPDKGELATQAVRDAAVQGGGKFSLIQLDLADLDSVRSCAAKLQEAGKPLDIIIANAGVMATPFGLTKDGYETQFGTNFIGHFVLINRLFSLLKKDGRVIILSSGAHSRANIDLNDINFTHSAYDPWIAYGRSKTACALLALELNRRAQRYGICAIAVHPGSIRTELQRHYSDDEQKAKVASINEANRKAGRPPFRYKNISQGAATSVWAAVVAPSVQAGGRYCEDCHVAQVIDGEGLREGVRSYAADPDQAKALWNKAEELTGETTCCFADPK